MVEILVSDDDFRWQAKVNISDLCSFFAYLFSSEQIELINFKSHNTNSFKRLLW